MMGWMILVGAVVLVVGGFLVTGLFGAPYVPSKRKELREAFTGLKKLTSKDVVVDFGCGDGVVLRAAVNAGAGRAVGIELNPMLAMIAKWRNRRNKKVQVKCANMLSVKLPEDMTVAYIFGLDRVMRMLLPRLKKYAREQGRDIWVVSLAFEFKDMRPVKRRGAYVLFKISG